MAVLNAKFEEICKDIAYGLLEGYEQPIKTIQTVKPAPKAESKDAPYGQIYAVRVASAKSRGSAEVIRDRAIKAGFNGAYLELVPYSKEK